MRILKRSDAQLLTDVRLERIAAAFELHLTEVLADAASIVHWNGQPNELEAALNTRHGWTSDEAFYFIDCVRLGVWCTSHGVPDGRRPAPAIS